MICNGYKDSLYIQMALLGRKLGKTIIMVVEKVEELKAIIDVSHSKSACGPLIGVRIRLLAKSSGKWATSGGENAKFGLSTSEVMEAARVAQGAPDGGLPQADAFPYWLANSGHPDRETRRTARRPAITPSSSSSAFRLSTLTSGGRSRCRLRWQSLDLRQQHRTTPLGEYARGRRLQCGRCLQRGESAASRR